MRIYLCTDMEGVAGILEHDAWCTPSGRYYEAGKRLTTMETNAAVAGFFDGGADSVLVADGHGWGGIDPELLDERAQLLRGWGTPVSGERGPYPLQLDRGFDCVAFIGQHPKAGTSNGHICHTGSFIVRDLRINGTSVGEFGKTVYCAAECGAVPLFLSGDLAMTREASALCPAIVTAAVKEGLTAGSGDECTEEQYAVRNLSAIHLSPAEARRRIREAARKAAESYLRDPAAFAFRLPDPPYVVETDFRSKDGKPPFHTEKEAMTVAAALNG